MRLHSIPIVIYAFTFACTENTGNTENEQNPDFLTGKFTLGDSTIQQFDLSGCFCNVTDSGIRITSTSGAGFGGQELVTLVGKTDTLISFDTWTCVGVPPRYLIEKHTLSLDKSIFLLNDSLTGKIVASGIFDDNKTKMGFEIAGHFKCKLRDSTYGYNAYADDLRCLHDSLRMLSLRSIAHGNPDSVVELKLEYRHFHLIKDEIALFKNLQRLSLSQFPNINHELISNFKFLRELRIDSDSLKQMPTNIGDLRTLELLSVNAPIIDVPESLYSLTNLKELDLALTNISAISPRIKTLKNLEVLNIGYTDMVRIPMEIFALHKLADLTLPDTLIPFKIKKLDLKSIRALHVPYSFLVYNKESLQKLEQLEWLHPTFVYSTQEEELDKYDDQIRWLEAKLPKVHISGSTYVNDYRE